MKTTDKAIIVKIDEVYSQLSPENLSCDGELPRSEQRRRYRALTNELQRLFVQLGHEITELEAVKLLRPGVL